MYLGKRNVMMTSVIDRLASLSDQAEVPHERYVQLACQMIQNMPFRSRYDVIRHVNKLSGEDASWRLEDTAVNYLPFVREGRIRIHPKAAPGSADLEAFIRAEEKRDDIEKKISWDRQEEQKLVTALENLRDKLGRREDSLIKTNSKLEVLRAKLDRQNDD